MKWLRSERHDDRSGQRIGRDERLQLKMEINMDTQNRKAVYTIIERPGSGDSEGKRSFWVRIGAAFTNRDGSFTIKLDALPVNGALHVRDWPAREDWQGRETAAPANANGNGNARSHADIFAGA